MKLLQKIKNFVFERWYIMTIAMLVFILTFQIIQIIPRAASSSAMANITDWGLSFKGDPGAQPKGNISAQELKKYDAYYVSSNEKKTIYLTFDAGYENGYMPEILDILRDEQVPAAFFLVGHYLKSQPDLVKRMVEEGHIVGNHTSSHPDMSKIADIESLKAELGEVESLFRDITGSDLPKYYRPPQGKFNISNLEQAKQLGYKTVFWSLAYVDWDTKNQPAEQYALDKLNSRIHNGAVVLLHSTSSTNKNILKRLIQDWKSQGYEFKSLDDLVQNA